MWLVSILDIYTVPVWVYGGRRRVGVCVCVVRGELFGPGGGGVCVSIPHVTLVEV